MNTIMVLGHLGKDPELEFKPDTGNAICRLSIADNLPKRNGQDQPPQWFNVTAFGKLAENANEYLGKGSHVLVQGRLQRRDYTAKDGTKGTALDLVADKIEFLDPRPNGDPASSDDAEE